MIKSIERLREFIEDQFVSPDGPDGLEFRMLHKLTDAIEAEIAERCDVDSMQLIVRCRDCKGYRPGELYGWCSTHMTAIPREDGFCAWGVPADSVGEIPNRGLNEGRSDG